MLELNSTARKPVLGFPSCLGLLPDFDSLLPFHYILAKLPLMVFKDNEEHAPFIVP